MVSQNSREDVAEFVHNKKEAARAIAAYITTFKTPRNMKDFETQVENLLPSPPDLVYLLAQNVLSGKSENERFGFLQKWAGMPDK